MDPEQRQQLQQTADRTTVFCLLTLVIGSYIIWINLGLNVSQTTALLLPMAVIGVVHLLGGTIAISHAAKTAQFTRNILVYGYFFLFFILVIRVIWVIFHHHIVF